MFKWTTLVLTGLACCLTLPALTAGTDMGCLPPPLTQDYVKKTVRVEIKGKLVHHWTVSQVTMRFPGPSSEILEVWEISVGGKTYTLDLGPTLQYAGDGVRPLIAMPPWEYLDWQAGKLVGKTVIVTGTLDGTTVHVTGLKADEDYLKQTTEVEVRGRLRGVALKFLDIGFPNPDLLVDFVVWNVVVDGKTYSISFASPELEKLVGTLDGQAVMLTGVLDGDTITVKTLKAAQ